LETVIQHSILVISRDIQRADIIRAGLELSGYHHKVATVDTVEAAQVVVTEHPPKLVIFYQPDDMASISFCHMVSDAYGLPLVVIGGDTDKLDGAATLPLSYRIQDLLDVVQQFVPLPGVILEKDFPRFSSREEEARKYRDLFDRASDAITLTDFETHRVVDVNERAIAVYGYSREGFIGMNLLQIVPDEQHPSMLANARKLASGQTPLLVGNRTYRTKDGVLKSVSISVSLIEYGGRMVFQGIVRDETERLRYEAELVAMNTELQRLTQVKDQFVSNVSHELRTPITSLKMRHNVLANHPERLGSDLPVLMRETARLEGLIENLLVLSRLDQDRQAFEFMTVDLNDLVEEYLYDRAPIATEKGLTLTSSLAADLPPVQANPALLGQVLSILMTNAFNYTPPGGQVIVATQSAKFANRRWTGFSIQDTGPGIAPDEQANLFTRFFRGSAGRASGMAGTGLGLAIAKEIIDRHEGRIEVESAGVPGEGTTFSVWL
jgi:PAS domain S-box-containing protein